MDDVFAMAGLRKNAAEDKWEVDIASPHKATKTSSEVATSEIKNDEPLHNHDEDDNRNVTTRNNHKSMRSASASSSAGNSGSSGEEGDSPAAMMLTKQEDGTNEDHEQDNDASDCITDSTRTSSKKKRSHKKKKTSVNTNNATGHHSKSSNKSVRWGNVEEVLFARSIGYDHIPTNGAYPLGLGEGETHFYIILSVQSNSLKRWCS